MTQDTLLLVLVALIVAQTSFLTYRQVRSAPSSKLVPVFVDTSVLMDGRIVPVAETGFVPGKLVIPRSVVAELQLLADGSDNEKRERARRGLDVVKTLQAIEHVAVEILQDGTRTQTGVDDQLLMLAKKYHGMICTIDFNLNKVAQVEGIRVLNINELAQQLRMTYLPGDRLNLQLKHQGSDSHQAVGHLSDGTMVVVEQARSLIGKTVDVEVIRSLQTHAGRMMFARIASSGSATKTENKPAQQKPKPTGGRNSGRQKAVSQTTANTERPAAQAGKKSPSPRDNRSSHQQKPRRPRTSKQSEASLIDLVNSQDNG